MSLTRNNTRRSAPQPPVRNQSTTNDVQAQSPVPMPRTETRRSAPGLQRQQSIEDNTAVAATSVRDTK